MNPIGCLCTSRRTIAPGRCIEAEGLHSSASTLMGVVGQVLRLRVSIGVRFVSTNFFSGTTVGREKVVGTVNTLPGVQTETEQDDLLEEVLAGDAHSVDGAAFFTDNLFDGQCPCLSGMYLIVVLPMRVCPKLLSSGRLC
jgi:hypothetical protein